MPAFDAFVGTARPAGLFVPCMFMLEDAPEEELRFESFPVDEGITEGYNADYTKDPLPVSEPRQRSYRGGDWNPIQFTLHFRAGISLADRGAPGTVIGRMINKVNWLEAAAFPRTTERTGGHWGRFQELAGGGMGQVGHVSKGSPGPPIVVFFWGLFMNLRGRVIAWTVQWQGPYDPVSGKPHGALVGLTYQPESGFYPNWWDVKGGKMPQGITGRVGRFV